MGLKAVLEAHQARTAYVMLSGGVDSTATLALCRFFLDIRDACHINTGIGIKSTREHVRQQTQAIGMKLKEIHPQGKTYRDLVIKEGHGFPDAPAHPFMYRWLKERSVRKLVRDAKRGWYDRIGLITGVRQQESDPRMGSVCLQRRQGAQLWIAPILHLSKAECRRLISDMGLKPSPASDLIHMSGECLCGAYAHPHELEEIALWFPEDAQVILELMAEARQAGIKRCQWGDLQRHGTSRQLLDAPGPLCQGCG